MTTDPKDVAALVERLRLYAAEYSPVDDDAAEKLSALLSEAAALILSLEARATRAETLLAGLEGSSGAESVSEEPDGSFASDASRKSEWREPPRSADRRHAVELEAFAGNQRPKTRNHRDPRLYQYEGTNLYQWYSKTDSEFLDPFGEPFVIPPQPEPLTVPEASADGDGRG